MSRPKSGAARPPSQAADKPAGVPLVRIDNKKNGVPQDALKQAVFDKPKVAKKVFTGMDKDKDKKLSKEEFVAGFRQLLEEEENISDGAIDALWKQTDTNLDGFVSWDEFRIRFCVDPARNFDLRLELPALIEPYELIMSAMRPYLKIMYDNSEAGVAKRGGNEMWTKLGFDYSTKFNAKTFKALCEAIVPEEQKHAAANNKPTPRWIAAFEAQSKDEVADMMLEIETKNNGTVNLTRYDKRLGMVVELPVAAMLNYKKRLNEIKVKGGKKGSKKDEPPVTADRAKTPAGQKKGKGKAAPKPVVLKSIAKPLEHEWLCQELFNTVTKERPDLPTRVAPALKNWNINEKLKWDLEQSDGSRCYIFLSDSMEVKKMVRDDETKLVVIYCTYRVELNGLHTYEWLYHAKIFLDKHEEVKDIESRPIQCYKSGREYPLPRGTKKDFREWIRLVPVPDIFVPSVQPREY